MTIKWFEFILWLLKQPYSHIIILLLCVYFMIDANAFNVRNVIIDRLQHWETYPQAKPSFASFVDGNLTTDEGSQFFTCQDTDYGGRSNINLKTNLKPGTAGDNYLQAKFNLERGNDQTGQTYICFFSDFSTPQKNFDISQYKGISFKSRLNLTRGNTDKLQLIIGIASEEDLRCNHPHEHNYFTSRMIGKFDDIKVPFEELGKPAYMKVGTQPQFTPENVNRVIFSVRGEGQEGTLDVDDINFYK